MLADFVYSDQDGCNSCTHMYFELGKGTTCHMTRKQVQPYNNPCLFFNRILRGFGE